MQLQNPTGSRSRSGNRVDALAFRIVGIRKLPRSIWPNRPQISSFTLPTSRYLLVPPDTPEQRSGKEPGGTADHTKFAELQQDFQSGPEVTKACLGCHTEAGKHFMKSVHWTWEYENPVTGQVLGKKTLINTFCTNARGNEGACAQCHAGYGWVDDSFDFTDETKIDCLVCHDNTGLYYRMPQSEGNAACAIMFENAPPIDWKRVASSVGMPRRRNCGQCHFYGGGDDGVKHGDLDSSLFHPDEALDVHMDENGLNFSCTACHVTKKHLWAGNRYNVTAKDTEGIGKPGLRRDVATCESCHGTAPHPNRSIQGLKLNDHVERIACQTCHIPALSRGGVATMTDWDWRTAGKLKDGFGYFEHNYTQGNAGDSGPLLSSVALIHTAAAFVTLAFIIVHIYLFTIGHSFREHVMPMVSGFDEVDLSKEEEAYLERDEPGHIRCRPSAWLKAEKEML